MEAPRPKFYAHDDDAWDRFCAAIPSPDEAPASTMEIWHRIVPPKPTYGETRKMLHHLVNDELLTRVRGKGLLYQSIGKGA